MSERDIVAELREGCSRHIWGQCSTRRCLTQGGWSPGDGSGYEKAACTEWAAAAEILRLRAELADTKADKDDAYEERNKVVALLARLFPSGLKKTDIPGWNPAWHGCVYIDLPTGQVSWHYHETQTHLFDGIQPYLGEWDGHDTPEKYRRVAALTDCSSIFRTGWIAGRDAAAEVAGRSPVHSRKPPRDTSSWAMGVEDAMIDIAAYIREQEPPA